MVVGLVLASIATATADPVGTRMASPRIFLDPQPYNPSVPSGLHGYVLMDAATGAIVAERNADRPFIPASLAKIPTMLSSLSVLGESHRFRTELRSSGTISDGVLYGDLHLVGGGDPSLRSSNLRKMASDLAAAGVVYVEGGFFYHRNALPVADEIDSMQPKDQKYNPPVSGLNLDYNVSKRGGQIRPVLQPGLRAARVLQNMAASQGIILPPPLEGRFLPEGDVLSLHESAPLADIVKRMMARSTNLTAEVLGASAAHAQGHWAPTLPSAAAATEGWLRSETSVSWDGFHLENHSGLSVLSRATPRQMAAILRRGYQRFGQTFVDLHKRTIGRRTEGYDLRGKIGTMRFVRGLGGFLTVGGRDLIVVIMANDPRHRALADAGELGLPSANWMHQARRLERDLLTQWITEPYPMFASR